MGAHLSAPARLRVVTLEKIAEALGRLVAMGRSQQVIAFRSAATRDLAFANDLDC